MIFIESREKNNEFFKVMKISNCRWSPLGSKYHCGIQPKVHNVASNVSTGISLIAVIFSFSSWIVSEVFLLHALLFWWEYVSHLITVETNWRRPVLASWIRYMLLYNAHQLYLHDNSDSNTDQLYSMLHLLGINVSNIELASHLLDTSVSFPSTWHNC